MGDSFIIAIDFGTAYSGYAFNIPSSDKESDPYLKMWGNKQGLPTPKTPTCILFNEDEDFMLFGYEAKAAYINMRGDEAKKHLFFENFKMALYGRDLNRDITIKAANGKEMTAMKVFTESLRFLKEDALETISSNNEQIKSTSSTFTWVLTVPAIWDHSAKQFMREAAAQAGIVTEGDKNKLVIALEPEAASIWCKKLPADCFITQNLSENALDQSAGTKYIVVDCGGGTIDMTVHEVLRGGALKELHKASGNDLGGQTVDRKFKEFLREIFCDGVWDEYERNYPSEVQEMMYDFTFLKQLDEDVEIYCSFNLGMLAQKKQNIEKFFESVEGASWDEGAIKISRNKLRSFFAESLKISEEIGEIIKKDFSIDYVLLVGGFANSLVLRQHSIDQFSKRCKVLCPVSPQEAIVRGAVEFGRNPEVVVSRKSRFTYGVAVCEPFDESKYKPEKKITADGKDWCQDVFGRLLDEGQDVYCKETTEHVVCLVNENQKLMEIRFYRTERKDPKYVDDWGVEEVGSVKVDLPDITGGREREVRVEILFGSTEITATATDVVSGSEGSVSFNFLTEAETS